MTRPLLIALLMSGCVFGAETDTVGSGQALVRIHEVQAEAGDGLRAADATFLPDFETGANELLFDGEGWTGSITFEDLASTIQNGGSESILIERDGGSEVLPMVISSTVIPIFGDQGFDRRATLTFVTYIENRSVQVVIELDLADGYDC